MNWMNKLGTLCVLGGAVVAVPASASAQCWEDSQLAATRVRDLQTMLMAATLRCRAAGMDISDHYNSFVSARHGQLELANAAIKHRFAKDGGQTSYDRFTTALANAYGDASTTPAACDEAAQTADDAAASPSALFELADQRITPPDAEAGRCARTDVAAAAAPAPVAEAAVEPRAAVATMVAAVEPTPSAPSPEEVAAAITVLTRYQAVQARLISTTPR